MIPGSVRVQSGPIRVPAGRVVPLGMTTIPSWTTQSPLSNSVPRGNGRMLTLSPMLAVIAGMVFMVKAGMLSGSFYVSALALFLTAVPMSLYPAWGQVLFGAVTATCFFVPGLKYYRQHLRSRLTETEAWPL